MKYIGWISIGLGLVAILVRHVVPFLWIFTFIIAGIGFLVGIVGMTNKEDRSLSIAGIAVCIIAGITHIGSIWMLLLLGVSAYLVFFRKPKNDYDDPNQQYLDE